MHKNVGFLINIQVTIFSHLFLEVNSESDFSTSGFDRAEICLSINCLAAASEKVKLSLCETLHLLLHQISTYLHWIIPAKQLLTLPSYGKHFVRAHANTIGSVPHLLYHSSHGPLEISC